MSVEGWARDRDEDKEGINWYYCIFDIISS